MSYPYTRQGYNIYDLMSLLQKGIRRGRFEDAGFAAKHLKDEYRPMMWNRMFVVSSEDCYGVITKELVELREQDNKERDDEAVSRAIALMCKSLKSRDACYFSCNFILSTRKPRDIEVTNDECRRIKIATGGKTEYDSNGFQQMTLGQIEEDKEDYEENIVDGAILQKALKHRDTDMAGYYADKYRKKDREFLWKVLIDNVGGLAKQEVKALHDANCMVNKNRKDKDEIFLAKACMIEMYDTEERDIRSSELIHEKLIDWDKIGVKNINDCNIQRIPEYTYDCHTLKGKRMGKTDWDMTVTEQAALYPLANDYFSEASWIYTYEDDYKNGVENDRTMAPIREYAKTHPANPVEYVEYDK